MPTPCPHDPAERSDLWSGESFRSSRGERVVVPPLPGQVGQHRHADHGVEGPQRVEPPALRRWREARGRPIGPPSAGRPCAGVPGRRRLAVEAAHGDAGLGEELQGQLAADVDDDEVVGEADGLPSGVEPHRVLLHRRHLRGEQRLILPAADQPGDAGPVGLAAAGELGVAVGDGHLGVRLGGQLARPPRPPSRRRPPPAPGSPGTAPGRSARRPPSPAPRPAPPACAACRAGRWPAPPWRR